MIKEKPDIVLERCPYRYITWGTLENGSFDCRIQKYHEDKHRYYDMYLCDNTEQMMTAIQDAEYTKWLDPSNPPCYVKDCVKSPYGTSSGSI